MQAEEKNQSLRIEQVREWMKHPITQSIKKNYLERMNLLRETCLQGHHINIETGQLKATYAFDVGQYALMQLFLSIWDDPHSFLEGIQVDFEETKDG